MKPSRVSESLNRLVDARIPVFIWGAPGVGKSSVVRQVAAAKKIEVVDIRAVLLDPVDLRGLPHVNGDNRAHWCPPAFLPHDADSHGILFLDELNAAPPLTQAACYQLVLDRRIGEYKLPDGWTVIAAGNRESDRAVTHRMPSPLANRFVHVEFETDLEDWVRWALEANVTTEVISFIRFKSSMLYAFDAKKNTEKAFPSPRTWEYVSRILTTGCDAQSEFDLITGTVGEGAAAEFVGYLKVYRDLPSPDQIMMNPAKAPIPKEPSARYAICGTLARKASENTIERLVTYYNRLPAEFSVLAMRDSVNVCRDITHTKAYMDWATKHADVIL